MYLNQSNHSPYMGHCVLLNAEQKDDQTTICTVADCSGELEVVFPTNVLPPMKSFSIPPMGIPTELFLGCAHGTPLPMKINVGKGRESLTAIPPVFCPESHKQHHTRLMTLLQDNVIDKRCSKLLHSVLTDDFISGQFQSIPASKNIHHIETGGLLRHTLEVVEGVLHSPIFKGWNSQAKSLALTVATLHDIGKCHKRYAKFSFNGISHEDRSLELIAEPLRTLEERWSDGAELLRLCLVKSTQGSAESAIRSLVKGADQASAANDAEIMAFRNTREWQSVAKPGHPNQRLYFRAP